MTGPAAGVGGGEAEVNSSVLMSGLLPHRGWEALGDDPAEHQQEFPTPRRREARPGPGQRPGPPRRLRARGGTVEGLVWDMVALRAIGRVFRRDVAGTIARAATAPSH